MFKNVLALVGAGFICHQIYMFGKRNALKEAAEQAAAEAAADERARQRASAKPAS